MTTPYPHPSKPGSLVVYYYFSHRNEPLSFNLRYSSLSEASAAALWHFNYGVGNISTEGVPLVSKKLLPKITTNKYGFPTYSIPPGTPKKAIPWGENCNFVKSWVQRLEWDPRLAIMEIEKDDDDHGGVALKYDESPGGVGLKRPGGVSLKGWDWRR